MTTYVWQLYNIIWREPLKILYFKGPAIFGFWQNRDDIDICSDITTVTSLHWTYNPEICESIKEKHFESFHIGITSFFYISTLFLTTLFTLCHCCCIRPIIRTFNKK